MHPVLIRLGPLTIHTYGVFLAAGFLFGLTLALRQARKQGLSPDIITNLAFYIIMAAIIGSRLLYVIMNPGFYIKNPISVFKLWEGGLIYYGGAILAVVTAIVYVRKNRLAPWDIADLLAPSIAISYAVGRLGCLFAGCCYGRPSHGLPWGITFSDVRSLAPVGVELHPTQPYSSLGAFLIFSVLLLIRKYQSFRGQLICTYAMLYAVLRFVVEAFRDSSTQHPFIWGLSSAQGISILLFLTSVTALVKLSRKS